VRHFQLLFIAAIFAVTAAGSALARRLALPRPDWLWRLAPHGIGGMASYWVIVRIAAF
jgi:hypothetical protein